MKKKKKKKKKNKKKKKKKKKNELDKIQNEAARIATGTTNLVSIHVLYPEIRRDTLQH